MKRIHIGEFEEIVLLFTMIQHESAYGLSITEAIKEELGRSVTLSSVHTALYRLEEKGLVASSLGEPSSKRGGRRKRLYTITNTGKETLREVQENRQRLWSMIPKNLMTGWQM